VLKNDTIFPKQQYLKEIEKDENSLRKNQRKKGQPDPMMGRYSD